MEMQNPYAAPSSDVNAGLGMVDGQQVLASAGARLGARFLDGLVEFSPLIIALPVGIAAGDPGRGGGLTSILALGLGYLAVFAIWVYQVVRLVRTGQTLGKKWLGVKVVRTDGGPASFGSHFLRGLIMQVLGLIDWVFIFRADRRCLHDMAGETKVIVA
jgi:uncharacterized RDD family membrane protein YckC